MKKVPYTVYVLADEQGIPRFVGMTGGPVRSQLVRKPHTARKELAAGKPPSPARTFLATVTLQSLHSFVEVDGFAAAIAARKTLLKQHRETLLNERTWVGRINPGTSPAVARKVRHKPVRKALGLQEQDAIPRRNAPDIRALQGLSPFKPSQSWNTVQPVFVMGREWESITAAIIGCGMSLYRLERQPDFRRL